MEELDPTQYFEARNAMLTEARKQGVDVYPHKFHVSSSIPEFVNKYKDLELGIHLENVEVSVAGIRLSMSFFGQTCNVRVFFLYCRCT